MQWADKLRAEWLRRAMTGLELLAARRGRTQGAATHLLTGAGGEEAALLYLLGKGYKVVARRWSSGNLPGDLDLVAWQGSTVCFIEVKTRTQHDAAPAEIGVDLYKRKVLRRLAQQYLRQLPTGSAPPGRFDVLSIYEEGGKTVQVEQEEEAFAWREPKPEEGE